MLARAREPCRMEGTMNERKQNQKRKTGWIRKCLLPVLLLALVCCALTGEAQAAGKKKTAKKAAKAEQSYSISRTTALTEDGEKAWVELYINKNDKNKIRDSSGNALSEEEGKNLPEGTGKYEDYYNLSSGSYKVVSGTAIMVNKVTSGGSIASEDVYWYQKTGDTYKKVSEANVQIGADTVFGCDWDVTAINFLEYRYPDKNGGKVLVGTTLDKAEFVIEAKLSSGKTLILKPEDYSLEPGTDKVPFEDKLTFHPVKILYTKNGKKLQTSHSINVTQFETVGLTAVCTNSKGYHVGDTIKESDFKLYEVQQDVVNNRKEKTSEIGDSFSLKEGSTVAVEGMTSVEIYCPGRGDLTAEVTVYGYDRMTVEYKGKEVVVGKEIDTSKVAVTMWYKDGTTKKLSPDDYTISPTMITHTGENEFTVVYDKGGVMPATFTVLGIERSVSKLEAKYKGPEIIEGGTFLTTDLEVWAIYNDDSREQVYDFLVSTTVLEKKGTNKITITYGGQSVTINITGAEKKPNNIVAVYRGEPIIEGGMINTNDVSVTAYFNDGTNETVTDFSLSMNMLTTVGTNTVTVTYKKVTTTIFIVCMPRMVTALEAMYKGPEIVQNSSFNRDQVVVTATFNNGEVEQVTDFILASTLVPNLGMNTFQVTYGTMTANFQVIGIARTITGSGTMTVEMDNEDYEGVALVALIDGQLIREDMELEAEVYEPADLKKVVRKTTKKGKYFGFELEVDGFEFAENQYMTAQIAIPDGFDASKVAVYYTPNRESVMAKLGGGLVSSNVYEFYAYRSGTYVLLECDKQTLKEADLRGGQSKPFIFVSGLKKSIKVGDKLNLTAMLMYPESDKEPDFVWSVDDTSVARVTSKGVLTARDSGTVELMVKTKDGKISYTYEIEVE